MTASSRTRRTFFLSLEVVLIHLQEPRCVGLDGVSMSYRGGEAVASRRIAGDLDRNAKNYAFDFGDRVRETRNNLVLMHHMEASKGPGFPAVTPSCFALCTEKGL